MPAEARLVLGQAHEFGRPHRILNFIEEFRFGANTRAGNRVNLHFQQADMRASPFRARRQLLEMAKAAVGRVHGGGIGENAQAVLARRDRGLYGQDVFARRAGVKGQFARQGVVIARRRVERAGDLAVNQPPARLRQAAISGLPDKVVGELEPPFAARLQQAAALEPVNAIEQSRFRHVYGRAEQLRREVAHCRGGLDDQLARRVVKPSDPDVDQRDKIASRRRDSLLAGARQFSEKQGIAAGMSQNVSDLAGVGPGFEELRRVLRTQRRGLQPLDGAAFHEHPDNAPAPRIVDDFVRARRSEEEQAVRRDDRSQDIVQQRRRPFVDPLRVVDHQDGWTFRTYAGQQAGHGGEQAGPASFVAARRVCRRSKQGQVAPQLRIALRCSRRPQRVRPSAVWPNRFRLETARRKNARAGGDHGG